MSHYIERNLKTGTAVPVFLVLFRMFQEKIKKFNKKLKFLEGSPIIRAR